MSAPTPQIGPIRRAWYRWKMLRLPWRKRFLVGQDLEGNTYWVFRDLRDERATAVRWRRIVQYPSRAHHSDVRVSPQWHQWLRYTREHPPTLAEQAAEVARQARIKVLAAEADARWAAQARVSDPPARQAPALDAGRTAQQQEQPQEQVGEEDVAARTAGAGAEAEAAGKKTATTTTPEPQHDPWKRATGPSETWQPEAWTPKSTKRQ